jgi:hypothetical protein
MSYRILKAANSEELEVVVSRAMVDGWAPIGGVAIARKKGCETVYAQAIIKPEKNIG